MSRFDISRLRKEKGLSQNELARLLQINQSFLSAIENGKSPLPIEKEEKLCEVLGLDNLDEYVIKSTSEVPAQLNEMTDSDLFNQLLNRFHQQAHSGEHEHHHHDHHERIDSLQKKVDSLFERNNSLMDRNDKLWEENNRLRMELDEYRKEIDSLREQIFRLKTTR